MRAVLHAGRKVLREPQPAFPFEPPTQAVAVIPTRHGPRAIEDDAFPFEALSDVAELESWRKEINRPLSHLHKWWAQRLGTVFRAIVLGALAPKGANLFDLFYRPVRVSDAVVFDPFMGSGTTVTEAVKLGARAIGRDINPVAYFRVRNALAVHDRAAVFETFRAIERDIAGTLRGFYEAELPSGGRVPVLYYFWVKTVPCPACDTAVDLFKSYIFAQHAYAKRFPEARAICPHCADVNTVRFDAVAAKCSGCRKSFDPSRGPARGQKACCPSCDHEFSIAKTVREGKTPPDHRMYAKLVLMPDGSKAYLAANEFDRALYAKADTALKRRKGAFPVVPIAPGYNTNQALSYNYRHWHEFFNARQLLGLSILGERIQGINDATLRDLFVCLFSGALEFNNMFASYKGEGTGAVRHMFYHHILKPERVPLEANLWGTTKSSGSFSTMFESRIVRALDYADNPFELRVAAGEGRKSSEKVYGLSEPIGFARADSFAEFERGNRVYLSCGDSGRTDLASGSVDVIVTDPPFFDNVHYSQLADFFHVWQRHLLGSDGAFASPSTRSVDEVQNSDSDAFTERLGAVWAECHRVLKDEGLLVFTYHHSRGEGWRSILKALMDADFGIVAAHPVKAEMSVATPKHQAKEPIDLDIVVVCRKRATLPRHKWNGDLWERVTPASTEQVRRLQAAKRWLSRNDVRVIVMGQLLRQLSISPTAEVALALLDEATEETENVIGALNGGDATKEIQ
jgi:adenine-specific DNA methylase